MAFHQYRITGQIKRKGGIGVPARMQVISGVLTEQLRQKISNRKLQKSLLN
jgi:hypothetical protein